MTRLGLPLPFPSSPSFFFSFSFNHGEEDKEKTGGRLAAPFFPPLFPPSLLSSFFFSFAPAHRRPTGAGTLLFFSFSSNGERHGGPSFPFPSFFLFFPFHREADRLTLRARANRPGVCVFSPLILPPFFPLFSPPPTREEIQVEK